MQSQQCRTLGLLGTNRLRPLECAFQDASAQPRVNVNKYIFAQKHPETLTQVPGLCETVNEKIIFCIFVISSAFSVAEH